MDALKRKWPFLLACALSLGCFLLGYRSIHSVKEYRKTSIARKGAISHLNPLDIRWEKKTRKRWIGITLADGSGNPQSALAHVRFNSNMAPGDSVVAYFAKGKVSATIANWRDWVNGVVFSVVGAWLLAMGIFLRNLLDPPPEGNEDPKKSRKNRKPGNPQAKAPKAISFSLAGIGSLCLFASAYLGFSQVETNRNSVDLNAVVVDFRGITYEYAYPPGSIHRRHAKSSSSEWSWMDGDSIPIRVDTRNPSQAQIRAFTDQWFAAAGMGVFGVVFGGIGFVMLISNARINKPELR